MVIMSFARSTVIHLEKRVLTLAAQHIDGETLRLAYNSCSVIDRPQQNVRSTDTLHQHPAYALRNVTEWLQCVERFLEAIFVVGVEVSLHRLVVGVTRVNGMMIREGEEITEEFFNHRFQFLLVEGLLRRYVTGKLKKCSGLACAEIFATLYDFKWAFYANYWGEFKANLLWGIT